MMYMSPHTVRILHEERVREAQKLGRNRMITELAESMPVETEGGLLHTIKQWLRPQRQERQQGTRDVRRATVV